MPSINEIRKQFPQYDDLNDQQLADGFHEKFYSDIPKDQFYQSIGLSSPKQQLQQAFEEKKGNAGGPVDAAVGGFNSTFPFGHKITSALGAGIAKAGGVDDSFSNLYDQAELDAQATAEANPKSNIAGSVLGIANTLPLASTAVLSGVRPTQGIRGAINAIPEAAGAIADWAGANTFANGTKLAKAGNAVVQLGKGAIVGAPGGAIYGASESPTGQELQGALTGAGYGAGLGAAVPVISSALGNIAKGAGNVVKGAVARSPEQLEAAGQGIKDISSRAYQQMRNTNAVFNDSAKNNIISEIDNALSADGPLNQGLHGNTVSVLNDLKTAAQQPDFSLEQLDQYRRLLGRIPRSVPEDVRKSSIVVDALDSAVNGIGDKDLVNGSREAIDALNQGRQEYAKFSKFDRVRNVIDNSGGDANKLKNGLARLASNPKQTRGFTQDELSALKEASENTTGEGLLKMAGKFGIDLGSSRASGNAGLPAILGAIGLNGAAAGVGGLGTAGLTVAGGTAARQAQKYVARAKADDLLKLIEQGGTISPAMLQSLPAAEGKKLLQALRFPVASIPAQTTKEKM